MKLGKIRVQFENQSSIEYAIEGNTQVKSESKNEMKFGLK